MEKTSVIPTSNEIETDSLSSMVFTKIQESLRREEVHKIKLESLQQTEIELKINTELEETTKRMLREREVLLQQLLQAEEQKTSLRKQFNELYEYCETLYKESEHKRMVAEEKMEKAKAEVSQTSRRFEEYRKRMGLTAIELAQSKKDAAMATQENTTLLTQIAALTEQLQYKSTLREQSLASLERGKDFVKLATKSLSDFFGDFHNYLESVEKHGLTPINLRTGKLFIEHWNLQKKNLEKTSNSIADLMSDSPQMPTDGT